MFCVFVVVAAAAAAAASTLTPTYSLSSNLWIDSVAPEMELVPYYCACIKQELRYE